MFSVKVVTNIEEPNKRRNRKIFDVDCNDLTPKPLTYTQPVDDKRKSFSSSRGSTTKTSVSKSLMDEIDIDQLEVGYRDFLETDKQKQGINQQESEFSENSEITIYLQETPTFWLLDINSSILTITEESDVQEVTQVQEVKEAKPNRHKKRIFVQTCNTVRKKKTVQTSPINHMARSVFATEWDLYDTYRSGLDDNENNDAHLSDYECDNSIKKNEVRGCDRIPEEFKLPEIEEISFENSRTEQVKRLFHLPKFKHALEITERLLASNIYTNEQTLFTGFICDTEENIDQVTGFHYTMKLLWTFSYERHVKKNVTAICWNSVNANIVAAGYGKYFYKDEKGGLVCCWNVKNPDQPERVYLMNDVVTTLNFSKTEPNLLAVGCYKGDIILLNISTKTGSPIVINKNVRPAQFGPVWDIRWFNYTDFVKSTEEIISVGHNGHIWKWNHRKEYACYELINLQYSPPKVKSIINNSVDKTKHPISITVKNLLGLAVSVHPTNPMIFYVATNEGCVVKCAINHPEQYIDIFPAHEGSVYGIHHSPFCENIFLTYGSDWNIYLWIDNLHEPLLKLCCSQAAIEGAKWSPTHSTIIASISGNMLYIWDLSRRVIVPMSSTKVCTGIHLYSLEFSPTGKNILVGDIDGDISVYNLTDMPFPPYMQKEALIRAFEIGLISRPHMLQKLKNILSPTIPLIS